jgi:hypothetical protein
MSINNKIKISILTASLFFCFATPISYAKNISIKSILIETKKRNNSLPNYKVGFKKINKTDSSVSAVYGKIAKVGKKQIIETTFPIDSLEEIEDDIKTRKDIYSKKAVSTSNYLMGDLTKLDNNFNLTLEETANEYQIKGILKSEKSNENRYSLKDNEFNPKPTQIRIKIDKDKYLLKTKILTYDYENKPKYVFEYKYEYKIFDGYNLVSKETKITNGMKEETLYFGHEFTRGRNNENKN